MTPGMPNGVVLGPDDSSLFVMVTGGNAVLRFDAPTATVTGGPATPVPSGTPVSYTAAVTGSCATAIQWQHAPAQSATYADVPGATNPTFDVVATDASAGSYRVKVASLFGTTSGPRTLGITQPAPTPTSPDPTPSAGAEPTPTPQAGRPLSATGIDPALATAAATALLLGATLIAVRRRGANQR